MDGTKMLSGEMLVIKGGLKRASSLPTRGKKNVLSCGSYVEAHQVADTLRMRKELLQDERVEKWGILSQAEWIKEKQMALVTKQQGGHWSYIGHLEFGKKVYLYPEETLYLMELNSLQLRYGGVLVSFQQAYALLFEDAWALQTYKVYASLCRKGYKLLRHSRTRGSKTDETVDDNIILDKEVKSQGGKLNYESRDWRTYPALLIERESDSQKSEEEFSNKYEINRKQLSITWPETKNVMANVDLTDSARPRTSLCEQEQEMEVECLDSDNDCEIIEIPSSRVIPNDQLAKNSKSPENFEKRMQFSGDLEPDNSLLPNLFGKKVASFEAPPSSLLPPNIHLSKKYYFFDLKNMQKQSLCYQKKSISDDTDRRIAIEEQNIRCITACDDVQGATPRNYSRSRQNTSYKCHTRHTPYPNTLRDSHFHGRHIPFYQSNNLISNPFQVGYIQLNFRHPTTMGLQNSFFQHYDSRLRRHQQFHDGNNQINSSANRNVVNNTLTDYSDKMSNSASEKMNPMKKQTKHLELIKQCAIKCKELFNEQALPNTARILQSLLCTYNTRYNDFIFLTRHYEIEHAATVKLSSDSDYTATTCDSGKRRKRVKTKHQKRPKESDEVCYLSSSDDDCLPIPTESLNEHDMEGVRPNMANRCEKTPVPKISIQSDKNNQILAQFKSWMPSELGDFGRPTFKLNSGRSNQISEMEENVIFYQYVNCMAKNRFQNWSAIKASFESSLSDSALFSSEECNDNNDIVATTIKCNKIKSILRSEDCTSVHSVLKRLQIFKSGDSRDAQELKIYYDVYFPTAKCLKSSPPPPAFRVVCLNESESVPDAASLALSWSCCKDQIPLVFAVVGRDAISYVQMGPVDIPTLALHEDCQPNHVDNC